MALLILVLEMPCTNSASRLVLDSNNGNLGKTSKKPVYHRLTLGEDIFNKEPEVKRDCVANLTGRRDAKLRGVGYDDKSNGPSASGN